MISVAKKNLREQVHNDIASLPHDYIIESDKGIHANVLALSEFILARKTMIYHSVGREPDTLRTIDSAYALGKSVALPRCYKGGVMEAREIKGLEALVPGMLGIPAPPDSAALIKPEEFELIFVPGLMFDESGYRLGYGGGYYDRYLSETSAFTVGLARDRLVTDKLPREPHDISVKCLVTESRIVRF